MILIFFIIILLLSLAGFVFNLTVLMFISTYVKDSKTRASWNIPQHKSDIQLFPVKRGQGAAEFLDGDRVQEIIKGKKDVNLDDILV